MSGILTIGQINLHLNDRMTVLRIHKNSQVLVSTIEILVL